MGSAVDFEFIYDEVKDVTEKFSEHPQPMGSHIIFGENGKKFGETMSANIKTHRIEIVEAVLRKPGTFLNVPGISERNT